MSIVSIYINQTYGNPSYFFQQSIKSGSIWATSKTLDHSIYEMFFVNCSLWNYLSNLNDVPRKDDRVVSF